MEERTITIETVNRLEYVLTIPATPFLTKIDEKIFPNAVESLHTHDCIVHVVE